MMKLLGSLCVFAAGTMAWYVQRQERRNRRNRLGELIAALDRMETEIRLARTPMPRLLERLAAERHGETAAFLAAVSRGLKGGEPPAAAWDRAVGALPLPEEEQRALLTMADSLQGDEESTCKGVSLARKTLQNSLKKLEDQRPDEDKRATALCFSAAALVVILLI